MKRIAVIPGDGIGVEVTREALRVLAALSLDVSTTEAVPASSLEMKIFFPSGEIAMPSGSVPEGRRRMMRKFFVSRTAMQCEPRQILVVLCQRLSSLRIQLAQVLLQLVLLHL